MLEFLIFGDLMLKISLAITLIYCIICGFLARRKNRSVIRWVVLTCFLGLIALIILAFLSDLNYQESATQINNNINDVNNVNTKIGRLWTCSECGAENSGGNFCCNCSAYKIKKDSHSYDNEIKVKESECQGREWICDCGTKNEGNRSLCKKCRAMRNF